MVPAEDHDAMVMALRGSEFAKMIGNIPPEITEDDFGDIAEQIEAMVKPLTESNCPGVYLHYCTAYVGRRNRTGLL